MENSDKVLFNAHIINFLKTYFNTFIFCFVTSLFGVTTKKAWCQCGNLACYHSGSFCPESHSSLVFWIRCNEMRLEALHRSPGIYIMTEENTGKPQLGDRLKGVRRLKWRSHVGTMRRENWASFYFSWQLWENITII